MSFSVGNGLEEEALGQLIAAKHTTVRLNKSFQILCYWMDYNSAGNNQEQVAQC